jgi:hypothetical protein
MRPGYFPPVYSSLVYYPVQIWNGTTMNPWHMYSPFVYPDGGGGGHLHYIPFDPLIKWSWSRKIQSELVRVPSFSRDLLPKTTGLAWETTCNGCRPPLYIDEGLRPIEPPKIDQIKSISRFTYALGVVLV